MESPQHGPAPVRVIDELERIDRLGPLDAYQGQVLELIRSCLADGVDAVDISGAVADANDALTRRLLDLAEAHLGPPRCRYQWLALGSHGRREQVLSSDQDHAIAYEPPAPGEEDTARDYLTALAGLAVPGLARAGIPLCAGGYMATHWCRPLGEFERLFRSWVEEPRPQALLQAEVFLDVRGCHGDLPIAHAGPDPPGRRIARPVPRTDGPCSSDVPSPVRLASGGCGPRARPWTSSWAGQRRSSSWPGSTR